MSPSKAYRAAAVLKLTLSLPYRAPSLIAHAPEEWCAGIPEWSEVTDP